MTPFDQWAADWGFPPEAVADLVHRLTRTQAEVDGQSEAAVQAECQLAASRRGDLVLWRNNSGALQDDSGRLIRFGLGHVSATGIKRMKSADLVGIHRPTGRFVSVEVKRPGWKHSDASERDRAQAAWAATVSAMGGLALRVTSARAIEEI